MLSRLRNVPRIKAAGHMASASPCTFFLIQVPLLLPSPMWLAAPCPVKHILQRPLLILFLQTVLRELFRGQPIRELEDRNLVQNLWGLEEGWQVERKRTWVLPLLDCYVMFLFKCVNTCFCSWNSSELSQDICNPDLKFHVCIFLISEFRLV